MKNMTIHFKNGEELTIDATGINLDAAQLFSDRNIKKSVKLETANSNIVSFRTEDVLYLIEESEEVNE